MGNPTSNAILERIHQDLGNIVWTYNIKETYIYEGGHWLDILAAEAFTIGSTENRLKFNIPVQLLFGRDMILPIKHTADWELIHQKNQSKININKINKNSKICDHEYKVGDKVMLNNNSAFKCDSPY